MRWRLWIVRTTTLAIFAAIVVLAAWWLFERCVGGSGYRWTTWEELADPTIKRDDGRLPNPQFARFLDGRKITLLAQRFDLPEESPPDRLVPIIRMPARNDALAGAPLVLLHETNLDTTKDWWRVVRVWGTLRIPVSPRTDVPAPSTLELQVDALGEDPRYLPEALAPARAREWTLWGLGSAAAVMVGAVLACAVGAILRCRWIGRTLAILSVMAAAALTIAAISTSRSGALTIYHGGEIADIDVMPRGIAIAWASDYYQARPTEYRWHPGPSYSIQPTSTWAGLGFRSFYTRYDWGNVHAHVSAFVATPWIIAPFVVFALIAWRLGSVGRYRPGTCTSCGYDLRATPNRCPECGTITAKRAGVNRIFWRGR